MSVLSGNCGPRSVPCQASVGKCAPFANRPACVNVRSPLQPVLPDRTHPEIHWGGLRGASGKLAIAMAAARFNGVTVLVTADHAEAARMEAGIRFFNTDPALEILHLPDWETLPYDVFSPHEDIISERLRLLARLPALRRGLLVVPAPTLMQRLAPREYIAGRSLRLERGQTLDIEQFRLQLEASGYHFVHQVMEHGEYTVRGSIIDLFPMGSEQPCRIDLFDDEIEELRLFSPDDQRSREKVESIELLPAHEFPLDEDGIRRFRERFRERFEGDPARCPVYQEVSNGAAPGGIEYYLPLFHDRMETLFDYLPERHLLILGEGSEEAARGYLAEARERHEQLRHDIERPILEPEELFLTPEELHAGLAAAPRIRLQGFELPEPGATQRNHATAGLPALRIQPRAERPAAALQDFLDEFPGRTLITAETTGRREHLLDLLRGFGLRPQVVDDWRAFLEDESASLAITTGPLEQGFRLEEPALALITEAQLLGERPQQSRRRRPTRDADAVIRNLADLSEGAPVVHEEHGVGRYLGLSRLEVDGHPAEFLTLEYAGGDKLYVPVSSLHLISRYTGASPEHAPLHKLGGEQWARARRKAAQKARDVAAELLDIHARRAARKGRSQPLPAEYTAFAEAFPFEPTPDQQNAIDAVLADLASEQPMDRVVCGDVGFGKTEVAMRAAFVSAMNGHQVAVLVPTTLLAQQHTLNFQDRFADWPVRIESLSRFSTPREQKQALEKLASGEIDIIIGTHKLLGKEVRFRDLGLVIIDEEHRFGVRHKERLKALRAEVDLLTLTATPIPRTLNMSLSGLRDLSIIATPPVQRHAIKTFVSEWKDALIQEACRRELRRGGQVYFLHNEVKTIEEQARKLERLLPDAKIRFAHGQMRERELEQIMVDFYHQRFNVLVATTIIESGIDIPSANTIIINRADKLGLAQLHQLRGRVGRSHHRAYAYLLTPPRKAMTADAIKRLQAIEALEDLGVGFSLASHDLEIRGAGELLGEEQSGQISEVGFTLYNELLERAVKALKSGQLPDSSLEQPQGIEIELGAPALLPEDYVPDVHTRLVLYKRIASAASRAELDELQVELIDRFGLLPEPAKTLFAITELKLEAEPLGIRRIEMDDEKGRIHFGDEPNINAARMIELIQTRPDRYRLDSQQRLHLLQTAESVSGRLELLQQLLDTLRLDHAA
ncbi:MAG: transcription-repair coupling factor [Gammaproteobacteria bacterium]|nr:MAG: transcription-repair coupling factor [Gammaproteobacteria bacterium]